MDSWGTTPDATSAPPTPPRHMAGRGRRRRETIVLCVAGALVVTAGVAVLAVARGGGDTSAGDDPAPATTARPGGGTAPAGPIVGPTGVLGSWSGTEWEPWEGGEVPGDGAEFSVVRLDEPLTTAVGRTVAEECPGAASGDTDLDLGLDPGSDGAPAPIAVAGIAKPRPRTVEVLDTGSSTYRQAAAEVAASLGTTTPPTLAQVLRGDLEGDGTDEVVVTAEHVTDPNGMTPTPGDWSVVFLRRVAGSGVETSVVSSSLAGPDGVVDRFRVSALADLNGDGTMELAVSSDSVRGVAMAVFASEAGEDPAEVLRAGCAA